MKETRLFALIGVVLFLCAAEVEGQRVMENLGRGVIAVRSSSNEVYVGWRLLATDASAVSFNLYRSTAGGPAVRLNEAPLVQTTDFVDQSADVSSPNAYFVRPLLDGVEHASSASFTLPADAPVQQFIQIPIQRPPDGVESCPPPAGITPPRTYTYHANDGSIADLDGDGQFEIVLKWDPSNSRDNGQTTPGCAGLQILDAYELDGTLLWRINMGRNIRSGAHYTQFMVYDLDSDGKAEVVMKTADGTVDGTGVVIGDPNADYVDGQGRILSGPEFLTVFDGATGAALATTAYVPPRGDMPGKEFGDNYGNRADRFLATVAYLDGVRPSVVFARGYYAKTTLAAWDWRDGQLTLRWFFNSKDPNHPENLAFEGQGNHNLSVADVDGDGFDEIVYGSAVFDHDGTGMFSMGFGHGDAMHVSRFDPSNPDLLVYGVHEINWINPTTCMTWPNPLYDTTLYNAHTGELVMATDQCEKRDAGRGMAAPLDPNQPGTFFWGGRAPGGLVNLSGEKVGNGPSSTNFAVWWDADLMRELEDGISIFKYDIAAIAGNGVNGVTNQIFSCPQCASNNGTKATPVLSGDLFGDWREEVIWRTADNQSLRIYTTTAPAAGRMYTLLQDPQYRLALAWQNVAYNQPPWPSFYIGPGMAAPPVPQLVHPTMLAAALGDKQGPPPKRVWTLSVTNTGTAPAFGAMIESVSVTHVSGPAPVCSPTITSPTEVPIQLGTIAPGQTVTIPIQLNVTKCSENARLKLVAPVKALDGAATVLILRTGEPR